MSGIVLHHYPMPTFSEKVRLALGLKGLAYRQVIVPIISPKPDQVALTGGYRRAPVMQIGADIYCDSHLILQRLEAMQPEPPLFPDGCRGQASALAWWAERQVFMPALGFIARVNAPIYPEDLVRERNDFGYTFGAAAEPVFQRNVQQFNAHGLWLRQMLADGRPFLLGDRVSAADLGAYPAIWFLRQWGGAHNGQWLAIEALTPWVERVAAIGHGRPSDITGAEAIRLAAEAVPDMAEVPAGPDRSGLRVGAWVTGTPDDVGRDPVGGLLMGADDERVVIRRTDPRAGILHVHFPRGLRCHGDGRGRRPPLSRPAILAACLNGGRPGAAALHPHLPVAAADAAAGPHPPMRDPATGLPAMPEEARDHPRR